MKRRYRAIGNPTKAQQAHQDAQRANGCAACNLRHNRYVCGPVRIHHRTIGDKHGQKQLGQDDTVALGDWHHQGVRMPQYASIEAMRDEFGPSLHHHKRDFVEWIQDTLGERSTAALQKFQDDAIGRQEAA